MSEALILLDLPARTAALTPAAHELKRQALEASALIGKVDDAATNANAVEAQTQIARVLKTYEEARKAAKDPVLQLGRAIDDTIRIFVEDVKSEQLRIATLVGDFQKLEEAKARAAEQARLAEERRLAEIKRQEELEVLRKAAEERRKLEAEAAEARRLENEARTKREREIAEKNRMEVERQRALAEAKSHEELDKINERHCNEMQALADKPLPTPVRARGQVVTEDWEITITDIWLLARSHPTCVKIEALNGEIKSLLKAGVKVAGIRAEKVTRSGTRTGRERPAITI